MKPFHKRDNTIGVTLWRHKTFAIELWYSKPNSEIKEHYHADINSRIIHLFGEAYFYSWPIKRFWMSQIKIVYLSTFTFFRNFKIKNKQDHGCFVGCLGLLFINIERGSTKSAAQDFIYAGTIK